jgi:hypothetical protein
MAIVARRYVYLGVTDGLLQKFVEPLSSVINGSLTWCEVSFDDTVDGITETVDQYMAGRGFLFDDDAGKGGIRVRGGDPAATPIDIRVDALGVVYAGSFPGPASILQWLTTAQVTTGSFLNAWAGVAAEQLIELSLTKILVPQTRTIKNAFAEITVAPGAGESVTFTLRKNGADTVLVVVIADANLTGSDTDPTHAVAVAPGDTLSVRMDKSAGAAALAPGGVIFSTEAV